MTGEQVTVGFAWRVLGEVTLEAERLRFPLVDEVPGLYRFQLPGRVYVGETDRLRRRFQHYRTPGLRQPTNIRLNAAIKAALEAGGRVAVEVVTEATIDIGRGPEVLDLSSKAARLLVESAAIITTTRAGVLLENL